MFKVMGGGAGVSVMFKVMEVGGGAKSCSSRWEG